MISYKETMRSSRIIGVIGAVMFFLSVGIHFASASLNVSNVNITGNNPYTVTFDILGVTGQGSYLGIHTYNTIDPGTRDWLQSCDGTISTIELINLEQVCYKNNIGDGSYSFTFTVKQGYTGQDLWVDLANTIGTDWYYIDWVDDFELANGLSLIGNSITSNSIWGSSNGFWGDTSIDDVTTAMEASVQATGANVWGLLTFVGIPLAFVLAGLMIYLINQQLTTPQSKVIMRENESNKEDFIYHSAEDLEFKRNYGQETIKRKRGRPKKIL